MKQKLFNIIISVVLIGAISIQTVRVSNLEGDVSSLTDENMHMAQQLSATRLATSNDSLQQSVEVEAAERKTQDEKLSKSIGSSINTLQGYIGTSSISNIADGTLRGAIGNTSIAGIGTSNNITSAINGLNTSISNVSTFVNTTEVYAKDNIYIYKAGRVVQLTCAGCEFNKLTTLVIPAGYRPKASFNNPIVATGTDTYYFGWLCVHSAGDVTARYISGQAMAMPSGTNKIHCTVSWII